MLEIKKRINQRPENVKKVYIAMKERREKGLFREWQRANTEKSKQYNEKRQHKNHKINKNEWKACKEYFNYQCAYCGLPLKEHIVMFRGKLIHSDFHKEHVNHNGTNDLSNCVPSCKSCNSSKHTNDMKEWYEKQEFFSEEKLIKIYN